MSFPIEDSVLAARALVKIRKLGKDVFTAGELYILEKKLSDILEV